MRLECALTEVMPVRTVRYVLHGSVDIIVLSSFRLSRAVCYRITHTVNKFDFFRWWRWNETNPSSSTKEANWECWFVTVFLVFKVAKNPFVLQKHKVMIEEYYKAEPPHTWDVSRRRSKARFGKLATWSISNRDESYIPFQERLNALYRAWVLGSKSDEKYLTKLTRSTYS